LVYELSLGANILIYDFKNMVIERFDPYGNMIDKNEMDDILEAELTWNTGLTYIAPVDYLPSVSFQTISNEENVINQKSGDLDGFCLAWCLWYLETKLKNTNIKSKLLVEKLIKN